MPKIKLFKQLFIIISIVVCVLICNANSYADDSIPSITKLTLGNWGTYPSADIWMTCGADFENVTDEYTVQFFLVSSEGQSEEKAIYIGEECPIKNIPDSGYMRKILGEKQKSGFLIHDLEPGCYYVGCKLSGDDSTNYYYSPFTVYSCAKDYVKAALDKVINSYIKEPDGWYWQNGQYVGLGYNTDDFGNSWESWMFPALGTNYKMDDGRMLDFSKNGPVLSSYDDRWFKDMACEWPITGTQSELWGIGMAELSKHMLAFSAYGENPRDINGYNLVESGIQLLYNSDGTVPYDENGEQTINDPIIYNYMIMALEVARVSPEEGYTRLLKDSFFKVLWNQYYEISEDYIITTPDNFAMALLALPMFRKYTEYEERVDTITANICKVIDYNIYANGAMTYSGSTGNNEKYTIPDADSIAVVINSLVMGGLKVEAFDEGKYTKRYGSLLTSLGSCITEDGVVYGDETNRMATYQTLGALVDLYKGQSCFEIAAEKYREAHPEYFAEGYGKLSFKSVSEISDQTYTGNAVTPTLEVIGEMPVITPRQPVYGVELPTERKLQEGLDYTIEYRNNLESGKATVIITGIGDYYGTIERSFNIIKEEDDPVVVVKKKQTMTVKTVLKKVSFRKLKKKAQVVKGALIVKNNKGKVSYKKISGSKKLTINKKTGRITVKKKTKRGTYKIRVKVTAAGNSLYKAGSRTVAVKIRVK